ncbi:MAG: glycoside hydrolase/phage tail family protein [Pseudomonadota bacterium]
MATLVLAAAGSSIGGAIGGSVLGLGAATVGQAAGAIGGSFVDQALLGRGSAAREVGRARALRLQTATEGAPLPISYGRMRIGGTVIWSTRFLEKVRSENVGGKATGGQRVREYAYSISFAVALGEGPIDRVARIWADGTLLDTAGVTYRVYKGDGAQMPDPKIEAVEGVGNAPAYRGTAYVVFEDLDLGAFGNRIPQLNFEVYRGVDPEALGLDPAIFGEPLSKIVRGVALSPGTGEHALHSEPQRYLLGGGKTQAANVNNARLEPDMMVSLDQLRDELPAVDTVSLIVSWFGSDLRCGRCTVRPKVEVEGRESGPAEWSVAGLDTGTAALISRNGDDRPNYGGTPSDASVIAAIRELKARGYKVMVYPFLLMDVTPSNTLANPYGGTGQPAFPWRGRITLDAAPGQPGSTDKTADAADEVADFFGTASAAQFFASGQGVSYSGPSEWTWRRFVLHLAALSKAAGGVDAFCIGSELRGLTTIRDGATSYPAVQQLKMLASEVRTLLPATQISYAADWSEYFGHQPGDGSGDLLFHLDPLWADPNIDFIGIDDYMSAADWRHEPGHADEDAARSIYELDYLRANVAGGEDYDWFYASEADRLAQVRSPIADGAYGEDWVFRPKDLVGWWSNPHHDRPGGVRSGSPTAWAPQSKPIWLTETGCPAVDLGANTPNVFVDPKSSESKLPTGSLGVRDDEMQRRFLQAKLGYWADPANNPVSSVYGQPMLPEDRVYVWTWDLRPWPDFPFRTDVWSDGVNHALGHWLTGRVGASGLAEVVAAICTRAGMTAFDVSDLHGVVHGYVIERTRTAREALQALMTTYGFDGFESGGRVVFRMRGGRVDRVLDEGLLVEGAEPGQALELSRGSKGDLADILRLSYVQAEADYQPGLAERVRPGSAGVHADETAVSIAFPAVTAEGIVARWMAETESARGAAEFAIRPSDLALEPGDIVGLSGRRGTWRIERLEIGASGAVTATRVDETLYAPQGAFVGGGARGGPNGSGGTGDGPGVVLPPAILPGPLDPLFLDLPLAEGQGTDHQPRLAVAADPWPGSVTVLEVLDGGLVTLGRQRVPAIMGTLSEDLAPGAPDRWQRVSLAVEAGDAAFQSVTEASVLNYSNMAALIRPDGSIEIVQFRDAVLTGPAAWTLGSFLRGLRGTEPLAGIVAPAGSRLVIVDRGLFSVPLSEMRLGADLALRAVPGTRPADDASAVTVSGTAGGAALRPFSPCHVRAKGSLGGDVTFSWIRRSRLNGDNWAAGEVPVGETVERYNLQIVKDGTLVRRVTVVPPTWTYTPSQQAADGIAAPFEVEVAQISNFHTTGTRRRITFHG